MILLSVAGATSATALGWSSYSGLTSINLLTQAAVRDAAAIEASLAGTTTAPAVLMITATVPVAGGSVTIGPSTITGTGSMDLWIFALPASVLTAPEPVSDDRVTQLERQVQQLMGLLSPPTGRSASCMTAEEVEEETKSLKAKGDSASDDLGASVHIPRGLLSQFMSGGRK